MVKKKAIVSKVSRIEKAILGEKELQSENQIVTAGIKKIEQYEKSVPVQLELFQVILPSERNRSNTVEFYDFVPKYVWGKVKRIDDMFLKTVKRDFECRGGNFTVRIAPSRLQDSDGNERDHFPGKLEELVEDALRKLATEGHGLFLDNEAAVTFTLYELQQELKRTGHSYSIDQIKNAIMVCVGTTVHITDEIGSTLFSDHLFETVGLQTREDWKGQGEKTKAFVRFNSLVTKSIREGTYRQFNYEIAMSYRTVVARQLHKRMSHHFTQASIHIPYSILLSTVIRDFGLTQYSQARDNLRDVCVSLDEMVEKEVLMKYSVERTVEKRKIVDAKLILIPHPKFASEVMNANRKQKDWKLLHG